MTTETLDPNDIYAGDAPPLAQRRITLAEGENVVRGTVLGRVAVDVTAGSATTAAKPGGNTGNGTITMDVTTPVKAGAKPGVYTARAIAAASDSGTFQIEDPDGNVIGQVVVGATFDDDIKFVIADGGTDFIVGDGFNVTVAALDVYRKAVAASTDGSQNPVCVAALDCNATDDPKDTTAWFQGEFNAAKLTYGAGHSATTVEKAFRVGNIPIAIKTLTPAAA